MRPFVFLVTAIAFAQLPGNPGGPQRSQPVIPATPQPATTITISVPADLATAFEGLRLNTRGQQTNNATGVTTLAPQYQDIQSLFISLLNQTLVTNLLKDDRWAPAKIKADKEAMKKCTGAGASDCIAAATTQLNADIAADLIPLK